MGVGVGICGRMVEIYSNFSLLISVPPPPPAEHLLYFSHLLVRRLHVKKTNEHVSGKMKSGKSAVNVMRTYLLSVVVTFC